MKKTKKFNYHFRDGRTFPTTADGGQWVKTDTSSAGAPTAVVQNATGAVKLLLANTTEVENLCLSFGDQLPFDIDELKSIEFEIACAAIFAATDVAVVGLASARNDDPDAIAANAFFKIVTSNAVVVETDDGTNDNDDKSTGMTLTATFRRCRIDFSEGTKSVSPNGSLGGKGAVKFFMEDANGFMRQVAKTVDFDMSNYAAGLQLYIQLQKTSASTTPDIQVRDIEVELEV